MLISDDPEKPNGERIDNLQTIIVNFNRFYSSLYSNRPVGRSALKKLLDEMELALTEK